MAVPSAVKRQRERLEAEFAPSAEPTEPPVEPSLSLVEPVVEHVPSFAAAPAQPDASSLSARIAELEHLLRTRDGQTSKSMQELNEAKEREAVLQSQLAALEDSVTELQKQRDTAEALATAKRADADLPPLDDVADLSPDEMEKFGADSVSFVQKLSKRELLAYYKPLLAKVSAMEKSLARLSDLDKLPQLEKIVNASAQETQRVKNEDFFRKEVLAYFPDFETVRQQQSWQDFVAMDIPGKGIKNGHLLNHYRKLHDALGIRSVLQSYYNSAQAKTTLADLATPPKTQTQGSPVTKPRYKASDYNTKLRAFTSRKLDRETWNAYKTEFNAAFAEGRVDMDARI